MLLMLREYILRGINLCMQNAAQDGCTVGRPDEQTCLSFFSHAFLHAVPCTFKAYIGDLRGKLAVVGKIWPTTIELFY